MIRKIITLVLLVFLCIVQECTYNNGTPGVGNIAPEITAKEWLNTRNPISLAKLRGKIVVVEFWATWCPPCRSSIPHLNRISSEYRGKGVVVIGLTNEDRIKADIDNVMYKMRMRYIVGTGSNSSTLYGVNRIPWAFLISPYGKILWKGHPMVGLEKAIKEAIKKFPEAG